jgi:hypothetical protein
MSTGTPLVRVLQSRAPAVAAASDATSNVAEAPFAGTVTEASYTADAAVSGANTETRTISVINRGSAGTGTTVVATLALTSGVDLVSGDEKQLTLSATAANLVVAADDILAFKSTHSGSTGLADPGGLVQVSISRTAGS